MLLLQSHFGNGLVFFAFSIDLPKHFPAAGRNNSGGGGYQFKYHDLLESHGVNEFSFLESLQGDGTYSTSESFIFNKVDREEYGPGETPFEHIRVSVGRGQIFEFCFTCMGRQPSTGVQVVSLTELCVWGDHKSRPS
jgi:hypothetical protein